jgi:hypothetical protein
MSLHHDAISSIWGCVAVRAVLIVQGIVVSWNRHRAAYRRTRRTLALPSTCVLRLSTRAWTVRPPSATSAGCDTRPESQDRPRPWSDCRLNSHSSVELPLYPQCTMSNTRLQRRYGLGWIVPVAAISCSAWKLWQVLLLALNRPVRDGICAGVRTGVAAGGRGMCGGSVAQLLLCEFRVAQDPVVALLASILQVHVATADHLPLNEGEHVR